MFDITARKLREGVLLRYEYAAFSKHAVLADVRKLSDWKLAFEPFTKPIPAQVWAEYAASYLTAAVSAHMVSEAFREDLLALLDAYGEKAPKTRKFLADPKTATLTAADISYIRDVIRSDKVPVAAADAPMSVSFTKYGVVASPTGKPMKVSSPPGFRPKYGTVHKGFDVGMPVGTPLKALDDGVVRVYYDKEGYGNYVVVEAGEHAYLYAHLSKVLVADGSNVKIGTTIALSGHTGKSSAPHLHFEVRVKPHGRRRATEADVANLNAWMKEAYDAGVLVR